MKYYFRVLTDKEKYPKRNSWGVEFCQYYTLDLIKKFYPHKTWKDLKWKLYRTYKTENNARRALIDLRKDSSKWGWKRRYRVCRVCYK